MITTAEALRVSEELLGTPYSTYDCINYIKKIIRSAAGGDKKYQTAGTNSLWRSRDLTWKQESLDGALPGMLAFKVSGEDVHHIGLVVPGGKVRHSSSTKGMAVETDLYNGQWHYLAKHKLIQVDEGGGTVAEPTSAVLYKATVNTNESGLNLRAGPSTSDRKIAAIPKGATVEVMRDAGSGWLFVKSDVGIGYVSSQYLVRDAAASETDGNWNEAEASGDWHENLTLISESGSVINLQGRWRLAVD